MYILSIYIHISYILTYFQLSSLQAQRTSNTRWVTSRRLGWMGLSGDTVQQSVGLYRCETYLKNGDLKKYIAYTHYIPIFTHEIWWNWTMLLIHFWDRVFGHVWTLFLNRTMLDRHSGWPTCLTELESLPAGYVPDVQECGGPNSGWFI